MSTKRITKKTSESAQDKDETLIQPEIKKRGRKPKAVEKTIENEKP